MTLKGLFLPGYACTSEIWQPVRAELDRVYEAAYVDWPVEQVSAFHAVSAFTEWTAAAFDLRQYDFVVGHSIGGVVALELAGRAQARVSRVVLLETFLRPPPPFFRNLALAPDQARAVRQMMTRQRVRYSPLLREALQVVDRGVPLADLQARLYAAYGDRGCGDPGQTIRELGWPADLSARITVAVVAQACHFPMIENPARTIQLLRQWIG